MIALTHSARINIVSDDQNQLIIYWLNQIFLEQTKFRFGIRDVETHPEFSPMRFWAGQIYLFFEGRGGQKMKHVYLFQSFQGTTY